REIRHDAHAWRLERCIARVRAASRSPDQHHVVGQTRAQPLCHGVVHGARTLTASYHQDYRSACCREPPAHARIRATWPGHGRRVNGVAGLAYPRPGVRVEADCRLAVTEVDLAGMAAEPSRGEAGH